MDRRPLARYNGEYGMNGERAVVIGAGLGGLSAAAFLARAGYAVTVIEQLEAVGGRAQVWRTDGFRFDIGPSWYWMPDEHDAWFEKLGMRRGDYYDIARLDPSFRVFFDDRSYDVPAGEERVAELFEGIERGAGRRLGNYLALCKRRYDIARQHFIFKPYRSLWGFVDAAIIAHWRSVAFFRSYRREIRRYFDSDEIAKMLSYPVVFLGSDAAHTPAVYTLMNWIDIGIGTWYPTGGFGAVVAAMGRACERLGVRFVLGRRCVGFVYGKGRGRRTITAAVSVAAATGEAMTDAAADGATDGQRAEMADGVGSENGAATARAGDRPNGGDGAGMARERIIHDADVIVANGDYPGHRAAAAAAAAQLLRGVLAAAGAVAGGNELLRRAGYGDTGICPPHLLLRRRLGASLYRGVQKAGAH